MDFALWRKPGPIETSFGDVLRRAMRGQLFPDMVHHYERVELETRAMIVSDWMMSLYTEVLFKMRGDDKSKKATLKRRRKELVATAEITLKNDAVRAATAARALKDHFEWLLPRAEHYRQRREDDYTLFLAQRRVLQLRLQAARLLQRVGRGKLWRVLLHISRVTRRDGLTTRSIEWERSFAQLLHARTLIFNYNSRKAVTDSAVEFARRGASDARCSVATARLVQMQRHSLDTVPQLLPAPWNWTIRRAELEERARLVETFIIAGERLMRWNLWKAHIRDLVLKVDDIPKMRVDTEVRRVWRTIECESVALSQRKQMHKECLKGLELKFQQYRRERQDLKDELRRKGLLPDTGVWDYDLDQPDFSYDERLSPIRHSGGGGSPTSPTAAREDGHGTSASTTTKPPLVGRPNPFHHHPGESDTDNTDSKNNSTAFFGDLGSAFSRPPSAGSRPQSGKPPGAAANRPGSAPTNNTNITNKTDATTTTNNSLQPADSIVIAGSHHQQQRPASGGDRPSAASAGDPWSRQHPGRASVGWSTDTLRPMGPAGTSQDHSSTTGGLGGGADSSNMFAAQDSIVIARSNKNKSQQQSTDDDTNKDTATAKPFSAGFTGNPFARPGSNPSSKNTTPIKQDATPSKRPDAHATSASSMLAAQDSIVIASDTKKKHGDSSAASDPHATPSSFSAGFTGNPFARTTPASSKNTSPSDAKNTTNSKTADTSNTNSNNNNNNRFNNDMRIIHHHRPSSAASTNQSHTSSTDDGAAGAGTTSKHTPPTSGRKNATKSPPQAQHGATKTGHNVLTKQDSIIPIGGGNPFSRPSPTRLGGATTSGTGTTHATTTTITKPPTTGGNIQRKPLRPGSAGSNDSLRPTSGGGGNNMRPSGDNDATSLPSSSNDSGGDPFSRPGSGSNTNNINKAGDASSLGNQNSIVPVLSHNSRIGHQITRPGSSHPAANTNLNNDNNNLNDDSSPHVSWGQNTTTMFTPDVSPGHSFDWNKQNQNQQQNQPGGGGGGGVHDPFYNSSLVSPNHVNSPPPTSPPGTTPQAHAQDALYGYVLEEKQRREYMERLRRQQEEQYRRNQQQQQQQIQQQQPQNVGWTAEDNALLEDDVSSIEGRSNMSSLDSQASIRASRNYWI